jgi:hypothetical protein
VRDNLERAHLNWVTHPDWPKVAESGVLADTEHPDGILARCAEEESLPLAALKEYLKCLGYPQGPFSYLWR